MSEEETTAVEEAPAAAKDTQNNVTRPRSTTSKTGQVWVIADKLSEQSGSPAARKDVLEACEAAGINPATAQTQFGRWKKYYGLGRTTSTATEESDDGAEVEE